MGHDVLIQASRACFFAVRSSARSCANGSTAKSSISALPSAGVSSRGVRSDGRNKGWCVALDRGSCRRMGRARDKGQCAGSDSHANAKSQRSASRRFLERNSCAHPARAPGYTRGRNGRGCIPFELGVGLRDRTHFVRRWWVGGGKPTICPACKRRYSPRRLDFRCWHFAAVAASQHLWSQLD